MCVCVCVCVCIYIYIYIYIWTESLWCTPKLTQWWWVDTGGGTLQKQETNWKLSEERRSWSELESWKGERERFLMEDLTGLWDQFYTEAWGQKIVEKVTASVPSWMVGLFLNFPGREGWKNESRYTDCSYKCAHMCLHTLSPVITID